MQVLILSSKMQVMFTCVMQAAEEWKQIQKEKQDKKATAQKRGWRQQQQQQQHQEQQQEHSTAHAATSDGHGHGSSSSSISAKDPSNMTWQQYCQAAIDRHRPHPVHISQPTFLTHEMPIFMVPALNLAAYWYLCGMGGLDFFNFKR